MGVKKIEFLRHIVEQNTSANNQFAAMLTYVVAINYELLSASLQARPTIFGFSSYFDLHFSNLLRFQTGHSMNSITAASRKLRIVLQEPNRLNLGVMKILLMLLFPISSISQTYEKSKDEYLNESYIRYYDRTAGIIVQKTAPLKNDTLPIFYEIALVTFKDAKSVDDIMRKRGVIVFEDKSFLVLLDDVKFDFLMEGKRQYTIRHKLTNEELQTLQQKKIDFINFMGSSAKLDKWQRQNYQRVFNDIINRKF